MDVIVTPDPTLRDVVDIMVKSARKGAGDPDIRLLVEEICRDIVPGDYASEVLALYSWVQGHVRYMRDIDGGELVKEPAVTLEQLCGDCDDMAVLLSAMLAACGNRTAFLLVAFNHTPQPTHVMCVVDTPGGLVAVDPVANSMTAQMLSRITGALLVPVTEGGPQEGPAGVLGDALPSVSPVTYSFYDAGRRVWQYWEAPDGTAEVPTTAWFRGPAGPIGGVQVGVGEKVLVIHPPESLGVVLPANARLVEEGRLPLGVVAVSPGQSQHLAPVGDAYNRVGKQAGLGEVATGETAGKQQPGFFVGAILGMVVLKVWQWLHV